MSNTINGRTPEEIKQASHCVAWDESHCDVCAYRTYEDCSASAVADLLMYVKRLERERDAAVRTARWQFERRGKDGMTKLPVCSGCGATPKYYAPKNDVGMQTPLFCHECGSRMSPLVKMEVE